MINRRLEGIEEVNIKDVPGKFGEEIWDINDIIKNFKIMDNGGKIIKNDVSYKFQSFRGGDY